MTSSKIEITAEQCDVLVIGAGAAGLMCALEAGKRGRNVIVLDHANKVGKKILMSGGGRCNFTNYYIENEKFSSSNRHFFKSALSRYTQWDFISLVESYKVAYYEKTLGQLFCQGKSKEIVNLLLSECEKYHVTIRLNAEVKAYEKQLSGKFSIKTEAKTYNTTSLVVATGGLSIPTMGASGFGYKLAEHFGLKVFPTRPGLVPFCLSEQDKATYSTLAGISADALVTSESQKTFREKILLTHRGISGPAILQISSYWEPGESVLIKLLPDLDLAQYLRDQKTKAPKTLLKTHLEKHLPKKLLEVFIDHQYLNSTIANLSSETIALIQKSLQAWTVKPVATEGYRTAEVTIGGVNPDELSSKTLEAKKVPGLYFIGEVVDVVGWLGGYNFQWAWSSGWAAGQVV